VVVPKGWSSVPTQLPLVFWQSTFCGVSYIQGLLGPSTDLLTAPNLREPYRAVTFRSCQEIETAAQGDQPPSCAGSQLPAAVRRRIDTISAITLRAISSGS